MRGSPWLPALLLALTGGAPAVAQEAAAPAPDAPHLQARQLYLEAKDLLRQNQLSEGIAMLKQAVELDPALIAAHVHLGNAYYQNKEFLSSIEEYRTALDLIPDSPFPASSFERDKIHYNLAVAAMSAIQYDDAEAALTRALALNPRMTQAVFQRGYIAYKKYENETALRAFQQVLEQDPAHPEAHLYLARVYVRMNEFEQAEAPIQTYLAINPDDPESHYLLSQVYENLGKEVEAEAERATFNRLKEEETARSEAAVKLNATLSSASALYREGQYAAAVQEYEQALTMSPPSDVRGQILSDLGFVHLENGELARARRYFTRAQAAAPDRFFPSFQLGLLAIADRDFKQGLRHFLRADRSDAGNPTILFNIGNCYLKLGNLNKAIAYFRRAANLAPQDPDVHEVLGQIYFSIGRRELAEQAYQRYREASRL